MGETILHHLAAPRAITKGPCKRDGRRVRVREVRRASLLASKVEKGPGAKEHRRPPQARKSKEKDSPLPPPEH